MSSDATAADPELPPVDARLVTPETRFEMYDGVLVHVPPADPPHGMQHSKTAALLEAYAAPDFAVAIDMLTRTSRTSDFAPDVSVFPRAPDPRTGGRQLEHLAFEIVSTQSLSHAKRKAAGLVARGVRRMFAIDVVRARVLEWSGRLGTWSVHDTSSQLDDPTLVAPLPIIALLDAAAADDAMARAFIAKRNPVIEAYRAEGVLEGLTLGRTEALLAILEARGVPLDATARARILDERDPDRLLAWMTRAATCADIAEVFGEA